MERFRLIFLTCCIAVIVVFGHSSLMAADFPEREIRLIVPTGPGGSLDRMARSVERFLPDILGARVIVENRKGAGGTLAIKHFLKQKADGHTILVLLQPTLTLIKKKTPDLIRFDDLSFINVNWIDPILILARKNLEWHSLDDMVGAIKENPNKFKYGVSGKFSTANLAGKILFEKLGLNVREIPYSTTGESRIALRGNHIDFLTAGAEGIISDKDIVTPMGIFWNKPIEEWPSVSPINEKLKKYNIMVPDLASIRFFAVHSDVKKNYPKRYQKLVSAWEELVTKHEGFLKFCDETGIGNEWHGPENSTKMIIESDQVFSKIKMPKKKKN